MASNKMYMWKPYLESCTILRFGKNSPAVFLTSNVYVGDKKKPEKVKGKIITNLKENYVKVIGEDY